MCPARRLQHRDYASPGRYFITACSNFKRCTFGNVEKGRVFRTPLGELVERAWLELELLFPEIRLHGHIVMPNHIHGIVEITGAGLALSAAPLQGGAHSLSVVVRTLKANVTRRARTELGWTEESWQENYYDRVIRDDREFLNALRYMAENPIRWQGQVNAQMETIWIKKRGRALPAAPLQRGRT